jgi:hypothetical protein
MQSLPTFAPAYSPGITKTYFIQELTECFKPSHNISLGPGYAHKLKTSSNIATLANITRHKERSMDTYLFQTSNKQIANPWHLIAVDTIKPWIILQLPHSSKSKEPTSLQALTIIDLNKDFMEIVALAAKQGKHHHCLHPQPSLALSLPLPS